MNKKIFSIIVTSLILLTGSASAWANSITRCLVIVNGEGVVTNYSAYPGTEVLFTTPTPASTSNAPSGTLPDFKAVLPAQPNADILDNDGVMDSFCTTDSGLITDKSGTGNYYYGKVSITIPSAYNADPATVYQDLYDDGYASEANSYFDLSSFKSYDSSLFDSNTQNDAGRAKDSDGHIMLTTARPDRTLVVLLKIPSDKACAQDPNDNNVCTNDYCDPSTGEIKNDPLSDINDNDNCTIDACNSQTGQITHDPDPLCSADTGNSSCASQKVACFPFIEDNNYAGNVYCYDSTGNVRVGISGYHGGINSVVTNASNGSTYVIWYDKYDQKVYFRATGDGTTQQVSMSARIINIAAMQDSLVIILNNGKAARVSSDSNGTLSTQYYDLPSGIGEITKVAVATKEDGTQALVAWTVAGNIVVISGSNGTLAVEKTIPVGAALAAKGETGTIYGINMIEKTLMVFAGGKVYGFELSSTNSTNISTKLSTIIFNKTVTAVSLLEKTLVYSTTDGIYATSSIPTVSEGQTVNVTIDSSSYIANPNLGAMGTAVAVNTCNFTDRGPYNPEECDGVDNDADGYTDNYPPAFNGEATQEMTKECDSDCGPGTYECLGASGYSTTCVSNNPDACVVIETCNGLDDNKDGSIDEGFNVGTSCALDDQTNACLHGVVTCDSNGGTFCAAVPVENGTSCGDGDACNGQETCQAFQGLGMTGAVCQAGQPMDADDHNACTTDSCNASTGEITHSNISTNDGNACTTDVCDPNTGTISHVMPGNLNDNNACTTDNCDSTTGNISHVAIAGCCTTNADCQDQTLCNGSEVCSNGTCASGTAVTTDDGDSCTTDMCNDATGTVTHEEIAGCGGGSCGDGKKDWNEECDDGGATEACNSNCTIHYDLSCDNGQSPMQTICYAGVNQNGQKGVYCPDKDSGALVDLNQWDDLVQVMNLPNYDLIVGYNKADGTGGLARISRETVEVFPITTNVTLDKISSIHTDYLGNIYIVEANKKTVLKLTLQSSLAGINVSDYYYGEVLQSDIATPAFVTTDLNGNFYVIEEQGKIYRSGAYVGHVSEILSQSKVNFTSVGGIVYDPASDMLAISHKGGNEIVAIKIDGGTVSKTATLTPITISTSIKNPAQMFHHPDQNALIVVSGADKNLYQVNFEANSPVINQGAASMQEVGSISKGNICPQVAETCTTGEQRECDSSAGCDPDDQTKFPGCSAASDNSDGVYWQGVQGCTDGNWGYCVKPTSNQGKVECPSDINDHNPCTIDTCDPQTGTVSHNAMEVGTVCAPENNSNLCATYSCQMQEGSVGVTSTMACIITGSVNVADDALCTVDSCDPKTGVVSHVWTVEDDNNPCTVDICQNDTGVTIHNPRTDVDDGNICTMDVCNANTGEITHNNIDYNDKNDCTVDSCDPKTGIQHTAIASSANNSCGTCGDGILNVGEVCEAGISADQNGKTCQQCQWVQKQTEYCGDGIVQASLGEECDGGKQGTEMCAWNCKMFMQIHECGDGQAPSNAMCYLDQSSKINCYLKEDGSLHSIDAAGVQQIANNSLLMLAVDAAGNMSSVDLNVANKAVSLNTNLGGRYPVTMDKTYFYVADTDKAMISMIDINTLESMSIGTIQVIGSTLTTDQKGHVFAIDNSCKLHSFSLKAPTNLDAKISSTDIELLDLAADNIDCSSQTSMTATPNGLLMLNDHQLYYVNLKTNTPTIMQISTSLSGVTQVNFDHDLKEIYLYNGDDQTIYKGAADELENNLVGVSLSMQAVKQINHLSQVVNMQLCPGEQKTDVSQEACNGVDDNKNGEIDEGYNVGSSCTVVGLSNPCQEGVIQCNVAGSGTICAAINVADGTSCDDADICNGTATCQSGQCVIASSSSDDGNNCTVDVCNPQTGAITHSAVNSSDNDACTNDSCDPQTGELLHTAVATDDGDNCTTDACDPQTGAITHTNTCQNTEICDGIDNDGDNQIDEGFDVDSDTYSTCNNDCDDTASDVYPGATEACDGIDNNCDGIIDEDCDCTTGETQNCGVGICTGTITCSDGQWGTECVGAKAGTDEICNSLDDDCDGDTDEGLDCTSGTPDVNTSAAPGTETTATPLIASDAGVTTDTCLDSGGEVIDVSKIPIELAWKVQNGETVSYTDSNGDTVSINPITDGYRIDDASGCRSIEKPFALEAQGSGGCSFNADTTPKNMTILFILFGLIPLLSLRLRKNS